MRFSVKNAAIRTLSTVRSDFNTLKTIAKISFFPKKYNPSAIAESNRIKREAEKAVKVEERRKELEREYRMSLERDGHESDEIEEQMLFTEDYLKLKAKVLSYEFYPFENNCLSKEEIEVENAQNSIRDIGFIQRMLVYSNILAITSLLTVILLSLI